jgi:polygalacturonase
MTCSLFDSFRNVDIYVDTEGQKKLLQQTGHYHSEWDIPTFPLNTDGIDPAGINVLIENITVQNYDDAVAVKPCNQNFKYCSCASNITVINSRVVYGVGMTIGSVPPNLQVNCIRNVLFENITFLNPFKAIYVKTNPGLEGTGIIGNITYRNIYATGSVWYPIWIGPQQEKQPGTNGTGCSFFYPLEDICPTQPRVTVSNIHLENIQLETGRLMPGVVLCDPQNPCTGFDFEGVVNTGEFELKNNYVCKNVESSISHNNVPTLGRF